MRRIEFGGSLGVASHLYADIYGATIPSVMGATERPALDSATRKAAAGPELTAWN
jgi:hypothetical protein